MLARTRDYLAELPEPARRHVERVNIRVMEEEIDGFVRRRDVWRRHLDELIELDIDRLRALHVAAKIPSVAKMTKDGASTRVRTLFRCALNMIVYIS